MKKSVKTCRTVLTDEMKRNRSLHRCAAQGRHVQVPRVQLSRKERGRGRGTRAFLEGDGGGSGAPSRDRSGSIPSVCPSSSPVFVSSHTLLSCLRTIHPPHFSPSACVITQSALPTVVHANALLSSPSLSAQRWSSSTSCETIGRRLLLTFSWGRSTAATGRCVPPALMRCSRRPCCTTGRPMDTTPSTMWGPPCC